MNVFEEVYSMYPDIDPYTGIDPYRNINPYYSGDKRSRDAAAVADEAESTEETE